MKKLSALTIILLTAALFTASPAFAYLDAGSGSMILQLLLGGIAGAAVFLKLSWKWLVVKLGMRKEEQGETEK